MSSDYNGRNKKKSIGFRFAWNGFIEVCKTERNFRFHLFAASAAIIGGALLGLSPLEWALIVMTIALVLTLEMVNSSLERLLDYLAPEHHPMAGIIKDIAAGAVLVASIASLVIAFFIYGPKLF
ncbi:diacylglycerol kinase family protein [Halobacillus sp. BBL2006]|uniref:diacylglycerol kinase family protein n=1 Tax=Halobacillus sp. BBL2006 TaxID=1543706 RepID=UPI00054236A3|nr:diacylglycerol kinase family protein [Halobacillus sp. BBL2006]KHE72841.1 diacylglycerol kinase [Halobacillus sp. BBL2006]